MTGIDVEVAPELWQSLLALKDGVPVPPSSAAESRTWQLYAPLATGRPEGFVIAQLGQSLDGRIATASGDSRYINCPDGIRHLHRMRALVDAVVVGIGTVTTDDPQLTVREVEGRSPARIVIDPNFRLKPEARILADDGAPVLAIQGREGSRPGRVQPVMVAAQDGRLNPRDIIAALAARGYRRILLEGGAGTVSGFIAAAALDRLHVSVAPVIIGAGPIGCNLPPIDRLAQAIRPQTTIHRIGCDVLFDCVLERG
ncbi:MAG TPA: dihydrofolate reductase family protein [Stellaceae bacterium]|nr:dihydrofolate reductase family protein [Stellaceae bacterium]